MNYGRIVSPSPIPNYEILDGDVRTILDKLRTSFPNAQVFSYTYKQSVGITSETDASGKTTYYEYDNFSRLKTIKDHNRSILKQYEYHYQGQ
ncbi:MAG: RHS repeat domain-containing protein [Bacteroidota bacterium]